MNKSLSFISPRLSLLMFLQFFVWGCWFVTVGNYMMKSDLGESIGIAYSLGPLAAILSPFFLGMIVDRFFSTEKTLGTLHLLGGGAMLCIPFTTGHSSYLFISLLFLHTLFYMPTLGLSNTLAFHHIDNPEKRFPAIRVFGTIGWIAAGVLVSKIMHADETALPLQIAGGSAILLGIYCFTLPHTPPAQTNQPISIKDILCLDALKLLKQPAMMSFFLSSLLICIPLAAYYAFAPVFVNAVGMADPAFKMSFGQVSEIAFMLLMPLLFIRLGVKRMLQIGMLAWVARYALFALSFDNTQQLQWMILLGIALHGICYDFFFVTGQVYVDKVAPEGLRGQLQGLLVMVTQGVGMLIGAQIAGKLNVTLVQNKAGSILETWSVYWAVPCIMALLVWIVFTCTFRDKLSGKGETPTA